MFYEVKIAGFGIAEFTSDQLLAAEERYGDANVEWVRQDIESRTGIDVGRYTVSDLMFIAADMTPVEPIPARNRG